MLGFGAVMTFAIALIAIFILGKILVIPVKIITRLIINGIIGGITLLIVNLIGGIIGISIAITPLTALIAGFLGVPGVLILLIAQLIT